MGKAQQLETRSHRGSMLHVDSNSKCSKRRIRWTQELHQRFEHAVAALGGAAVATPKGILDHMKAPDVTIMHVKSHLQKYRLTLTADGSGQNRYSGSDEPVSLQDQPSRRRLSVEAQAEAQAGDEGLSVDHDALRLELGEVDDNTQVPTDAPQATCTDNAARKKLVDTVVQQHAMQEELKHQIRVCIAHSLPARLR